MAISVLSPKLASRIAAGEVIERPASVVKELIENSLDAGATRIRLEVSDGGAKLVSVTDNGHGIGPDEIAVAFERFATSKIDESSDLSGIATLSRRYVEAVDGTGATILDTRKTTPGLRALERYAVRAGGGHNHRDTLADGVLIKDNHLAAAAARGVALPELLREAREHAPHTHRIEVEAPDVATALLAIEAGADIVMLDNMPVAAMREAVEAAGGRAVLEASGGVNLETVREIAATGVDLISVGALTHSAPALDISLEVEPA